MLADALARIDSVPALTGHTALAVLTRDVLAQQHTGPAAWICEPRAASKEPTDIGESNQEREQRFALLTLVSGAAGVSDRDLLAESETLRAACWEQLIGWVPDGYTPVVHVRDQLAKCADGEIYWVDEFKTMHEIG